MAIPATPSLVNTLLSGDNKVTGAGQMKLGSLLATDAFFTLLLPARHASLTADHTDATQRADGREASIPTPPPAAQVAGTARGDDVT